MGSRSSLTTALLHMQIDSKYKYLDFAWEVTAAAAAQGGRAATTEIFAPVQGFFQVPTVQDLQIDVSPFTCHASHPALASFAAHDKCYRWHVSSQRS